MRYSFIREHRGQFRVAALCRLLKVSPSGYFAWLRRPESSRARQNRALVIQIKAAHRRSRKTYGRRRIHIQLQRDGIACSPNRVGRLMRQEGLCGLRRRKFKATTNSRHSFPVAPNLLARNFTAAAPDQVWVSDITYLACEGKSSLLMRMEVENAEIVGCEGSEDCFQRRAA